jgi:hypothetical protein
VSLTQTQQTNRLIELGVQPDVAHTLNAETSDRVVSVLSEPLTEVRTWLVNQDGLGDDEADRAEQEFKRFAAVRLVSQQNGEDSSLVPPEAADTFLHTFLLFTHAYRDWSNRHFGRFLHHVPGRASPSAWTRTVDGFSAIFNETNLVPGTSSTTLEDHEEGDTWPPTPRPGIPSPIPNGGAA